MTEQPTGRRKFTDAELACPVCGQSQQEPPWHQGQGSLEICSSCGVQFGYSDMAGGDAARRQRLWRLSREAWIANDRRPLSRELERQLLDEYHGPASA